MLISVEQATQIVLSNLAELKSESIPFHKA